MLYTLREIEERAEKLLQLNPDPVPYFRILKDVLEISPSEPAYQQAKQKMLESAWARELVDSQWADGTWGRFHTQDTSVKQPFATTEAALRRCLALGLDRVDPPVARLFTKMVNIANGIDSYYEPLSASGAWMDVGINYVLLTNIAILDPFHPLLDKAWKTLKHLVAGSFMSGAYQREDLLAAFTELTGRVPTRQQLKITDISFLILNMYCVWLLSATRQRLPETLERQYLWHLKHETGIYYLSSHAYKEIPDKNSGQFMSWLNIHELLSRFPTWRDDADQVLDLLRSLEDEDHLWSLEPGSKAQANLKQYQFYQLSDHWRDKQKVKIDFSIKILAFIRLCLDRLVEG